MSCYWVVLQFGGGIFWIHEVQLIWAALAELGPKAPRSNWLSIQSTAEIEGRAYVDELAMQH